jgi:hypothetical protein
MRKVFCDPENEHGQVHGWAKTRRQYINEVGYLQLCCHALGLTL